MSKGIYQHKINQGFQKGYIPWNKNKKVSNETKEKISKNNAKFWLGKKLSIEIKKKISEAKKGCKLSEETKKKMSEIRRKENNPSWKGGEERLPKCLDCRKKLSTMKNKRCLKCFRLYQKNNPIKHSEKTKEIIRKKALGRKHTKETKEKMRKIVKNRNWVGEKHPAWKGGISKDKSRYNRIRRNRKFNAEGSHTLGEWETLKAQYNWICPFCKRKEPEIKLTEDHIIPLSKGGSDNIENIQPLCGSCNSKKYNKIVKSLCTNY